MRNASQDKQVQRESNGKMGLIRKVGAVLLVGGGIAAAAFMFWRWKNKSRLFLDEIRKQAEIIHQKEAEIRAMSNQIVNPSKVEQQARIRRKIAQLTQARLQRRIKAQKQLFMHQNRRIVKVFNQKKQEFAAAQKRIHELSQELDFALTSPSLELEEKEKELQEQQQMTVQLRKELDNLNQDLMKAERDTKQQLNQLSVSKDLQIFHLRTSHSQEVENFQDLIAKLNKQLDQEEKMRNGATVHVHVTKERLEKAETKAKQLEGKLSAMTSKFAEVERALSEAQNESSKNAGALKANSRLTATLEETLKEKAIELSNAKKEFSDEIAKLSSKKHELERQLASLKLQFEDSKGVYENGMKEVAVKFEEFNQEVLAKENVIAELKSHGQAANAQVEELRQLQESQAREIARLNIQLEEDRRLYDAKYHEVVKRAEELEALNNHSSASLLGLQLTIQEKQAQYLSLQAENAQQLTQIEYLMEQIRIGTSQYEEAQRTIQNLQKDLSQAVAERDQVSAQIYNTQRRIGIAQEAVAMEEVEAQGMYMD